jgi:hypothetical protein
LTPLGVTAILPDAAGDIASFTDARPGLHRRKRRRAAEYRGHS